jgi:hypothetical protein
LGYSKVVEMDPPVSLVVVVVVAAVIAVLGLVRAGTRLRRMGEGHEREALATSLWSLGGSAALILSIGMGLLSLSLWPRLLVLGGAVALVATGSVKSKRLRAVRERELLQAGAGAVTLVDQIEALEGQGLKYRRIPFRVQLTLMGGKAAVAGSALWALQFTGHSTSVAVFGTVALAASAWLGWDVVSLFQRKAGRERIDTEIERLLHASPRLSRERDGGDSGPVTTIRPYLPEGDGSQRPD